MSKPSREDSVKEQICAAFLAQYRKKHEVGKITVSTICKEVGISRTTFYSYYNDIYDVLQEMMAAFFRGLEDIDAYFYRVIQDKKQRAFSSVYMLDILRYLYDNRDIFLVLYDGMGGEPLFIHKFFVYIRRYINAMLEVSPTAKYPEDLIDEFLGGGLITMCYYWLRQRTDIPPEVVAEFVEHTIKSHFAAFTKK